MHAVSQVWIMLVIEAEVRGKLLNARGANEWICRPHDVEHTMNSCCKRRNDRIKNMQGIMG